MPFTVYCGVKLPPNRTGPLSELLTGYVDWALKIGYATVSINAHAVVIARFSEWLGRHAFELGRIDATKVNLYLRARKRIHSVWPIEQLAIKHLVEFLEASNLLDRQFAPERFMSPTEVHLSEWGRYLKEQRGIGDAAIHQYLRIGGKFLDWRFKDAVPEIKALSGVDVIRFYQIEARSASSSQCKMMTKSLRSYCRYLRATGKTNLDLAVGVPVASHWSNSALPKAIKFDVAEDVIRRVDRTTVNGRRDFAILLLLWRLGLRAGEISALQLNDIDWQNGSIWIRRRKSAGARLPLHVDVGEAIADYLIHGRPKSDARAVFLRIDGPHIGLHGPAAIGDIVRKALLTSKHEAAGYGAHQFRHGLATEMLRRGSSLADVGCILGHQSSSATYVYAKVDLVRLGALAVPWPTERHAFN